jgi:hypothetical protein
MTLKPAKYVQKPRGIQAYHADSGSRGPNPCSE